MQVALFVLGFLLFIGLVLIHEFGHFRAARRHGVEVEEFGLGFPPRAWARKLKSGLVVSLNWLPLGGFVKLKGEHDADRRPGSFGAASLSAKVKILLAGVTMNLLAAVGLFMILAWLGMPKLIDRQFQIDRDAKIIQSQVMVGNIQPGSPAAQTGLVNYDIVEAMTYQNQMRSIKNIDDLRAVSSQFAGREVELQVKHKGQVTTKRTVLRDKQTVEASQATAEPKGYLGVEPREIQVMRGTWSAPLVALGLAKQLTVLTLQGIWHALAGLGSTIAGLVTGNQQARQSGQAQASNQVGGLITVGVALWNSGNLGFNFMFMLIAAISLTLAIVNLLPIPALDGGRLVTILTFRALRRRLTEQTEELIQAIGVLVVLVLIVLVTIVDVQRFA